MIPPYLRRPEAAQYLREKYGIVCSTSTLATWVCKDKGPPFYKPSKTVVLYKRDDLDKWARSYIRDVPLVRPDASDPV
jgi:hypothetical protein